MQRVEGASVSVDGHMVGELRGLGLLVLVGVTPPTMRRPPRRWLARSMDCASSMDPTVTDHGRYRRPTWASGASWSASSLCTDRHPRGGDRPGTRLPDGRSPNPWWWNSPTPWQNRVPRWRKEIRCRHAGQFGECRTDDAHGRGLGPPRSLAVEGREFTQQTRAASTGARRLEPDVRGFGAGSTTRPTSHRLLRIWVVS